MLSAAVNARLFPGRRRPAKNRDTHSDVYHRRLCFEPMEDRRLLSVGVSGRVWSDLNSDGIQDAGERGVAGAVVEIYSSTDTTIGDADDVSRGVAISDASGNYAFSGLPDGLYYYEVFRTPVGYTFTTQDAGSDDSHDSDSDLSGITALFNVSAGQTDATRDAGLLGAAPTFGFAFSAGATENDNGQDLATDAIGNLYVTGSFADTIDFDPGPGSYYRVSNAYEDIFVAKYTPTGALVWARSMGGSGYDDGRCIAVANDGSVYITGSFPGTADFDPGPGTFNLTSAGGEDIFVLKLDTSGNFAWACRLGGTSSELGNGIAVASDGSVYTTGYFQGTVDFDPGDGVLNITADGGTDVFISKLNSAGNFAWVRCVGGSGWDFGKNIAVADDVGVYATGSFQDTVDFDPGDGIFNLTSAGGDDIFVWKLDSSGDLDWARRMGGTGSESASGISLDPDGSVCTTGYFSGTVDFDPGTATLNLTSAGGNDVFVSKLTSTGDFAWARRMGGSGEECGYDIAVADNGNVYTTGCFTETGDYDPGAGTFNLTNVGNFDAFVSELDSAGDFIDAYQISGGGDESSLAIAVSVDGGVYTTGSFEGTADFDPGPGIFNLSSTESDEINYDIFVSKLHTSHAQIDITLVRTVSAFDDPAIGERNNLPANDDWIDEWTSFYIEIWVSTPDSDDTGFVSAQVDLTYNTDYSTATRIEYGPAFTENQAGTIDDALGVVEDIGASTLRADVGDDGYALLTRLWFEPTADDVGVPFYLDDVYVPAVEPEIALESPQVSLVSAMASEAQLGGALDTELRAVPYDLDNSGRIDLGDLAFFAWVYREEPGSTTESPYAYAADYDRSGRVDLGDLAFFASNYRLSRPNSSLIYPPKFCQSSLTALKTSLTSANLQTPIETLTLQSVAPPAEKSTKQTNESVTETPTDELTKKTPTLLTSDNRHGQVDDYDATILAQHWMMTVGDSNDDDAHDEVFAEIGTTDNALLLYDE